MNPRSPVFPGVARPSIDMQAVRDQRRSRSLYFTVALDTARSIANGITEDVTDTSGKALKINAAGNSWWCDPLYDSSGSYIAGIAVAHFEDSALGSGVSTPITLLPNSAQRQPFTFVIIEIFAQSLKKLRVVYGVDIDFVPGFNAQTTIAGAVGVQGPRAQSAAPVVGDLPVLTRDLGYSPGSQYAAAGGIVLNTATLVFSAASNVNGAIVWGHSDDCIYAAAGTISLNAKATAPAAVTQGTPLMLRRGSAAAQQNYTQQDRPIFIAAGLGLWYFNDGGTTFEAQQVKYTLL